MDQFESIGSKTLDSLGLANHVDCFTVTIDSTLRAAIRAIRDHVGRSWILFHPTSLSFPVPFIFLIFSYLIHTRDHRTEAWNSCPSHPLTPSPLPLFPSHSPTPCNLDQLIWFTIPFPTLLYCSINSIPILPSHLTSDILLIERERRACARNQRLCGGQRFCPRPSAAHSQSRHLSAHISACAPVPLGDLARVCGAWSHGPRNHLPSQGHHATRHSAGARCSDYVVDRTRMCTITRWWKL